MTLTDLQKAALVFHVVRAAGPRGGLQKMKAISYTLRNRVRAGWHDSNWIRVIENADRYSAHDMPIFEIDPESRELLRMVREVEEIFYGGTAGLPGYQDEQNLEASIANKEHPSLYWADIKEPIRPWFMENIIKDHRNHPVRAHMGTMMFYE